jgi:hypothetical protein
MSHRFSRRAGVTTALGVCVAGAATVAALSAAGGSGAHAAASTGKGGMTAETRIAVAGPRVSGPRVSGSFPRLTPARAPAAWDSTALANGTAVLSYPPTMRLVGGDHGSVSAARFGSGGGYLLYLNATPRQGGETLSNWAAYRLRFLTTDDASHARLDGHATDVRFRGGTGSCVLDRYVTKVGAHRYDELACLAQGRTGASVIVGAAPANDWSRAEPVLVQAISAYQVR